MNFFKTSILSGINTVITMVLGLLTNKFIVIFIGSEGLGLIGQLKDFLKITLSLGQLGFDKGIIKYTSEHKNKPKKLHQYISTIILTQLGISIGIAILSIVFKTQIEAYLTHQNNYTSIFSLIAVSIIPMVLYTSTMSILNGLQEIKKFISISIIANIISSLLALWFIYEYGLKGYLINLALTQLINFLVLGLVIFKKPFKKAWLQEKIDKKIIQKLSKFSIMSISGTIVLSVTLIGIRKYLSHSLGLEYAGYWEALWRLSAIYISVLTSAFGFYLLPTFSKLYTKHLRKEVFKIWKITIPISIISGLAYFLLKDFIINLVYTEEFLIISSLVTFQVLGDIIKVNSWILGNLLLAKVHFKTFIGVQIGWSISFFLLSITLVQQVGFVGIALAYFITYILHFLFMNIYFQKLLWRRKKA